MDTNREYYLLLVDIRKSTKIPADELAPAMARLKKDLSLLRRRLRDELELGLRVTYGDEVAGLFTTPSALYDVATGIRDALHPEAKIRFVVARGRIAVASSDIRAVGGAVFKEADAAMERLKKSKRYAVWQLGDPLLDAALDSLTATANALLEGMTENQRGVFTLVREGLSRVEVAELLHKSKQSVSSAAVRGKADLVVEAEETISRILAGLGQRDSFGSGISR